MDILDKLHDAGFKTGDSRFFESISEITRLRTENEAMRRDAERYRWLRVQTKPEDFYSGAPAWEVSYQANGMGQVMRDEKLDYAIDAAQAQIKQYRDYLGHIQEYWNGDANESAMFDALTHIENVAHTALSLPQDTTALEAYVTRGGELMRERAVTECDETYGWHGAREAIRALPSVKLEDLK